MSSREAPIVDQRFQDSGEEAGTAPDDRRFRPDVEGLRAVAILLVVLFHAGVPGLTGGYVGVDVFFVISGFVITGLLLREHKGTGRTSLLDFYARRCRRILPAATLVILVAVLSSYVVLGVVTGSDAANDGRWTATFLANFHFQAVGTNYFTQSRPPSPLQNFWSLSVEEQFYIVYPTMFLLATKAKFVFSLRTRLAILLGIVIIGSYWLSIASQSTTEYFSPFTRAWELALGALVAVGTSWLRQIPRLIAAVLTWAGFVGIVLAAFTFNSMTSYPGSLVAVPVVGAGLIVAGGVARPRFGAERLLELGPFQWLGRRSYSFYLWHWPVLIIAAERVGKKSLPLGESLLLILLALVLSMVTYALIENPIRHARLSSRQSVAMGVGLVITTSVVLSVVIATESSAAPNMTITPAAYSQVVVDQVAAATRIAAVPKSIEPPLSQAATDTAFGPGFLAVGCQQAFVAQATTRICTYGDRRGRGLMVVYGDSHATMWFPALKHVAKVAHWRLVVLSKIYCPPELVTVTNPAGWQQTNGPYAICDEWHQWAIRWINANKPNMLIVTQADGSRYLSPSGGGAPPHAFSAQQWQKGLVSLLDEISVPNVRKVVLGDIPFMTMPAPQCLSAHPDDVQTCSSPATVSVSSYTDVERTAALESGASYIDTTPWFCSAVCTPIVGKYVVYWDDSHISATYALYLRVVLAQAVGVP